jgi:hypothetical protein
MFNKPPQSTISVASIYVYRPVDAYDKSTGLLQHKNNYIRKKCYRNSTKNCIMKDQKIPGSLPSQYKLKKVFRKDVKLLRISS